MTKILLALLVFIHALLHFTGFASAFGFLRIQSLAGSLTRKQGLAWMAAGMLFLLTSILLLAGVTEWWIAGFVALLISQGLIFLKWKVAWPGTLVNLFLFLLFLAGYGQWQFHQRYRKDVAQHLLTAASHTRQLITESDLDALPDPVKRYLRFCGVVGKEKVHSVKIVFTGEMRGRDGDWFPFRSVQYDFFEDPARLFFMKSRIKGLTVPGYHAFRDGKASMDIRFAGLIPVIHHEGNEMTISETVTLFNDLCLMAPAALLGDAVRWEALDQYSVNAYYTIRGTTISARLLFDDSGRLVDFLSGDRYEINEGKRYPFHTPVKEYTLLNGRQIPLHADAVWKYPDGDFVYGKFKLEKIEYNPVR